MLSKVEVVVDLRPMKRFAAAVESDQKTTAQPTIAAALKKWARRYTAFIRERFDRFSKGGGDWARLALSTILARRHKKSTKRKLKKLVASAAPEQLIRDAANVSILRDTGTLFMATRSSMGAPGWMEQIDGFGIRVGFGGPGRHPGGRATIADIASFHQFGTASMPAREILVDPDQETRAHMAKTMGEALDKLAK